MKFLKEIKKCMMSLIYRSTKNDDDFMECVVHFQSESSELSTLRRRLSMLSENKNVVILDMQEFHKIVKDNTQFECDFDILQKEYEEAIQKIEFLTKKNKLLKKELLQSRSQIGMILTGNSVS